MTKSYKKNGTIEFLRMLFCLIVLIYHFGLDNFGTNWRDIAWRGVLRYGALAVEFFFITSGYFMAKSVNRQANDVRSISEDTWSFMWKKLKSILPYHICFNLFVIMVNIVLRKPVVEVIGKVGSIFFLPTLGFSNGEWAMGSEWYIGNMLFAMLIIYPFLRKFKQITASYIAPIVSLIIYGYLAQHYGSVMGSNRILEAFAGILLGISVYTISEVIKKRLNEIQLNRISLISIQIYPVFVIVCLLLYMNTSQSTEIQPFLVLFLGSGLAVTFAEKGLLSSTKIMNNRFIYWLGKMSLPIYIAQNIPRMIIVNCFSFKSLLITYIVEALATISMGIVSYYVLEKVLDYYHKQTKKRSIINN